MASTYSPSLRLELMATGDQSGTWGDTTNINLGTLLEQAITGYLSVAEGDTTLTLTALDGAVDQSRNAVINLTGAMTSAQNVVVPTVEKVYLIKNSTSGGFSVVVKTAAGSGVTIPPGTSRWVYCDGTNVVDGLTGNQAANAFVPGYTTTATAAGTTVLTVASTQTQYFTGTTTQTITLPVTSTLVLGQEYEIVNNSTGSLTVNSSGGNLVATVLAGNTVRVQVILTSGTSAASWNSIAASVPNPLTLSGSTVGYTPLNLVSTQADAAAGPILNLYRDSATPTANDILGQVLFNGEDSAGNTQEYASIEAVIVDATSTSEDGALNVYVPVAGARTRVASFGPTAALTPGTNDASGLGVSGTAWSDLFLASGGVVNWDAGDVTITHSANTLAFAGASSGYTFDAPVTGTVTLATPQTTTSGTEKDFTVPSWVRAIDVEFTGVGRSGSAIMKIQLGNAGGIEATGYTGAQSNQAGGVASMSTGFSVSGGEAAGARWSGVVALRLANASTNIWNAHGVVGRTDAAALNYMGGTKALSAVITTVRVTMDGADTFAAGALNVSYS